MKENLDLVVLNASHAIIHPNKLEKVPTSEFVIDGETKVDHSKNGLFNIASPDFNTYYPGETAETIKPEEADFIYPVFRLLSEVVVHKMTNPIDFRENEVLKNSMPMLNSLTVYSEHEEMISNHLGVVLETFWQDSYKVNGVTVPAGINAVLKIDAKSNPKVARGILQEPPAIHSASVSVLYKWVKSHDMDDNEFYAKLGNFDEKGNLVRKIVNDIILYTELSLVPHGADPFAQILKEGKIRNPGWAKKFYSLGGDKFSCLDFKRAHTGDLEVEISSFSNNNSSNFKPSQKSESNMDEFIVKLGKSVGFEGTDQEELLAHVDKLISDNLENETNYSKEISQLKKSNEKLQTDLDAEKSQNAQLKQDEAFIEVGKSHLKAVREEAVKFYSAVKGEKKDEKIINIIENADFEAAESFRREYKEEMEGLTPLTCQDCHSINIERASAQQSTEEEDNNQEGKFKYRSNMEVIQERKRKRFAEKVNK